MLFSIPLFVFFSSLCFLTEQMENEDIEIVKLSNHQGEEPLLNVQRKEIFKECRRNHASSIGGFAVDGCCEFLPAGVEGTIEFFKCAACNCHRNFHRKEFVTRSQTHFPSNTIYYPSPTPISAFFPTTNSYIHMTGTSRGTTTSLDLPNGIVHVTECGDTSGGGEMPTSSKKRFRTKFTREQKKKMLDFAVKLGWKIRKEDENVVEKFCSKIGVKFQAFRVWMLNNKRTIGKQS
ncbi:zinc-finger homeodomain protein 2-like [Vicia villosa]|uniref:zinc-finger homeodomain protein 2-like n=1 Tax=Vicia villosa TaxID=3911 RepID=UPI00273AD9F7|nr:zinc-finger homeodomain protein 2-like [Vicia villosa]